MTGKLPTVEGDFSVAVFREVEFEEAVLFGEAEFETSAATLDDWPKMSAGAVAVKNSAAAGSSKLIRRNLLIFF
jgi:hypothetical protein